jgi:GNAT superfamily N-acetyltransferase
MEVQIRPYRPSDLSPLVAMISALYGEDMDGEKMTVAKIEATVEKLTREPNRGFMAIIEVENQVIGYAILIFFWSNEYGGEIINIDELYVLPVFRNKGVGRRFFKWLETEFQEKAVAFMLETTKENEKAAAFYRRIGFSNYRNLVMFKALNPN